MLKLLRTRCRTCGVLLTLAGLLPWLSGCVDKFQPDIITKPLSYFVVDGLINLRGVTTVKLSRTRTLNTTTAPVEAKATVAIQDENGTRYPCSEPTPGTYSSANLTLDASHRYQLRIRTAAGREYASDLVQGKLTPPIDLLSWAVERGNVQLFVDAHDATNATRYYRWTYQETWEFHPPYHSEYEYVNGVMRLRTEDVYRGWSSESSTTTPLSSTERLSQDLVSKYPLLLLPGNSPKLRIKYSILVQQYAQTAEEYAYWQKLKKNTETLGTLFDPLPTQLTGNVHCLGDAAELVVGYVGASSMVEKRLFIDRSELPPTMDFLTGYEGLCEGPDTVKLSDVPLVFTPNTYRALSEIYAYSKAQQKWVLIGYGRSLGLCADSRVRGTNIKPSFWP